MPPQFDNSSLKETTLKLLRYCQERNWAGYDPYDALNSRLLKTLPFLDFRLFRLALTQLVKRCPINLRPLLLIPPGQNPKGLALFITALLKLKKLGLLPDPKLIDELLESVKKLRANDSRYWCWGYNFPWQSRGGLFPLGMPNVICTTFVGNALMDIYDETRNPDHLQMAVSAAQFVLDILYYEEDGVSAFSYTPLARSKVHNASLLGAAYLCRVAAVSGEKKFITPALKATQYSVGKQAQDGSWPYGDHPTQQWIDNFHTGYNLCALRNIAQFTGTSEFDSSIKQGFDFFQRHFFLNDGTPKYYHDRTYPIDIHSAAQSIITLLTFQDYYPDSINRANSVCLWAMDNMKKEHGYFYFQKHPYYTNRIPFMRWSQAWMLLALATLMENEIVRGRTQPITVENKPSEVIDF